MCVQLNNESKLLHMHHTEQQIAKPEKKRLPHSADVHVEAPNQRVYAACGMLLALQPRPTCITMQHGWHYCISLPDIHVAQMWHKRGCPSNAWESQLTGLHRKIASVQPELA